MIFAPKTIALCFSVSASVSILVAAELYARRSNPLWAMRDQSACHEQVPGIGLALRPNCSGRWIRRTPSRVVFDTFIRTDAKRRRVTPSSGPRLAVFFGCSFTMGDGVAQRETLPYYYGEAARVRVLNYGSSGWGPQHALRILETLDPADLGTYTDALAVYTLIRGHSARASGTPKVLGTFGPGFPSYRLEAGRLVLDGTFETAHPWRVWLSRLAIESALLRRVNPAGDAELTAALLNAAARRWRRFGSRFVVLAWPGYEDEAVIQRLRCPVVRVAVDVSGLRFVDGHPRAEAYRRVADSLVSSLDTSRTR